MRTLYHDTLYTIRFHHVGANHRHAEGFGRRHARGFYYHGVTTCTIERWPGALTLVDGSGNGGRRPHGDPDPVASAQAYCSVKDRYARPIGRAVSLGRALAALPDRDLAIALRRAYDRRPRGASARFWQALDRVAKADRADREVPSHG